MILRSRRVAPVLFACIAFLAGNADAQRLQTIALSGVPIPSASSVETFTRFSGVNLNDQGDVVYYAELAGVGVTEERNTGIWINRGGATTNVAREGDQATGTTVYGEFSLDGHDESLINLAGNVLFPAALVGNANGSTGPSSLWAWESGVARLVARNGDRAPDTPDGVRFSDIGDIFASRRLSYGDSGKIAFVARALADGLGPRDPGYSRTGIWVDEGATQNVLVQSSDALPISSSTGSFSGFRFPVVTTDGEVVFYANANNTFAGSSGIWSSDAGLLKPIALRGEQAPGAPEGASFEGTFGNTAINQDGEIAFYARLTGNVTEDDYAIWKGTVDDLSPVVFDRDPAPGIDSQVFESGRGNPFSHPDINAEGDIAFIGSTRMFPTSLESLGVWATDDGILGRVVSLDSQVPAETELPPIDGRVAFVSIRGVALNDAGQVAFGARIVGEGIDSTNDESIWMQDLDGALQLVAREGGLLEVAPDDFRRVAALSSSVTGIGPSANYRGQFNNLGQLAFHAAFTDGTQGVFLASVNAIPEPASVVLAALCVGAAIARGRATTLSEAQYE